MEHRGFAYASASPSSRRAWIEIQSNIYCLTGNFVALLAEGVDRNPFRARRASPRRVALLAEGVDRNLETTAEVPVSARLPSSRRAWIEIASGGAPPALPRVALLAEGVDRNIRRPHSPQYSLPSPSSRRAWIEILTPSTFWQSSSVALLAEGVDRNYFTVCIANWKLWSPSSRRAWIEITWIPGHSWSGFGSPSSRRACIEIVWSIGGFFIFGGRPPRGGRG